MLKSRHLLLLCSFFMINLQFFIPELHAASVQLPATGQTTCYDAAGAVIACAGTGQDGDIKAGVAWPEPRFTDNANGTITDNLTGLIWLKNANCTDTAGGIVKSNGYLTWANALTWSNSLASGACGLTDGSTAGQWRLPNIDELESLLDLQRKYPALPSGHPFIGLSYQTVNYWSSSSVANITVNAWYMILYYDGYVGYISKANTNYVWPVRGGQ